MWDIELKAANGQVKQTETHGPGEPPPEGREAGEWPIGAKRVKRAAAKGSVGGERAATRMRSLERFIKEGNMRLKSV